MKFKMEHHNYNVTDLDASLSFYAEALGFTERRRVEGEGFTLVFIGNEVSGMELELTYVRDHPQRYDLGEGEFHLGIRTDDYAAAHAKHEAMGCICYENPGMGVYFIEDPDGYWLEIMPVR